MKYVWIWILLGIDVVWLTSSIIDVVRTVKYVRNNRRYGSVGDFINCMIEELEEYTVTFVGLHLFALFIVSFMAWVKFKIRGVE